MAIKYSKVNQRFHNHSPFPVKYTDRASATKKLEALGLYYMAEFFSTAKAEKHYAQRYMNYAEDQHFQGRFTDEVFDKVEEIIIEHFGDAPWSR